MKASVVVLYLVVFNYYLLLYTKHLIYKNILQSASASAKLV